MSVNKVQLANGETIIDISDSTVTPETLAEGVTAHDASGQKITGKMAPGGGSSVQSDWNQTDDTAADFIKNKPFGDMPTGGDTLYWDGNTEGLETDGINYKVSDAVPSIEDFANDYIITTNIEGSMSGTDVDFPAEETEFGIVFQGGMVVNVEEHPLPKGVYLYNDGGMYVSSLTIPGYTGFPVTKKMEEKYLPGAVILYADDALTYLYNSSDITNTENRMTLAKLKELVLSGIPIQVLYSGFIYCMATNFVDAGDMGGFGMLSILMEGASTMLYTAEYVPEG